MASQAIIINASDNVAVALKDLARGEQLVLPDGRTLTVLADIAYSHKICLEDIPAGGAVVKYGEIIGEAKTPIRKGDWVHLHNLDIEQRKG
jgi:hypothetical protein